MAEKEDSGNVEINALLAELTGNATGNEGDAEYPLPENNPVKFTSVDVVILPKGYKSEYPKPGANDSKTRVVDSLPGIKLDLDSAKEADGVFSIPVTVASSEHIYEYEDGTLAYKPFEDLQAAALFADGIGVSRDHPGEGIITDRGEILGFFKNPIAEDNLLKGILQLTDKDLIADVKSGKLTEVSGGFFCKLDRSASGEIKGKPYNTVQKNLLFNHIAVVENGRCSIDDGCGIGLDAQKYPVPSELVDKIKAAIERAKAMKDKSLYNLLKELLKGVSVKKDSEDKKKTVDADALNLVKVKDAFAKLTDERDLLKGKVEEIEKAEKESLTAQIISKLDSETKEGLSELTLDELQKKFETIKAAQAKRLSVPDSPRSSGRDAAYAKVGKGGK